MLSRKRTATTEEIQKLRELRVKGFSYQNIANLLGLSMTIVSRECEKLEIDTRTKKIQENAIKTATVKTYKLTDLPASDQKRYAECKPAPKSNSDVYTFGKQGSYNKAAIFDKRNV